MWKKIVTFESALLAYFKSSFGADMDAINANPDYNGEVAAKLHSIIEDFVANGAY